jgi:hypothetical protein
MEVHLQYKPFTSFLKHLSMKGVKYMDLVLYHAEVLFRKQTPSSSYVIKWRYVTFITVVKSYIVDCQKVAAERISSDTIRHEIW